MRTAVFKVLNIKNICVLKCPKVLKNNEECDVLLGDVMFAQRKT